MAMRQLAPVLHYLRQVHTDARQRGHTDAGLVEQFVRHGDEAAFTTLLQRYGAMVYGVCRRVLRDRHEAEDAFQATFLLLVRKARSLRQPELLGHWLYGVAYRTALKAKSLASRRASANSPVTDRAAPLSEDVIWRDLRPVLDDAINALPARYRVPFILCHLQGLTNAQAARQLGCPEGTVATRLARARMRLRKRLAKYGPGVAAGALALGVAENVASAALPALLLVSTVRIATAFRAGPVGAVPAAVAALTEGVSKAMFMAKLRFVLASAFLLTATVGGTAIWTFGALGSEPPAASAPAQLIAPVVAPPPVVRGVAVPPTVTVGEKNEKSAVVRTANFEVHAPTRRVAQLVGDAAERFRKSEAVRWLGKELPAWPERCPLKIIIHEGGSGSATTFAFDKDKVLSREMHLEGPLDHLLSNCLPHEVTHTILADHFRKPLPRWADEGAALQAEDDEEQQRHATMLLQIIDKSERMIPLTKLLPLKNYPQDVMALYCEGYSLTRFLLGRHDHRTFLAFVADGMKDDDWERAAKKYYDFRDVEQLERIWLTHAKKDAKSLSRTAGITLPTTLGAPPAIGRASYDDKEGRILIHNPAAYNYVQKTRYTKAETGEGDVPVTSYELHPGERFAVYPVEEVEATDPAGKPLDMREVIEAMRRTEDLPVVISTDGEKVNPYYLAVVKEGTIVLIPRVKGAVAEGLKSAAPVPPPVVRPQR